MIRWPVGVLCVGVAGGPACADIDNSAYEAVGVVRSDKERQELQRQFAAERAVAAAREAEFQARQQSERDAAAAREAARPYAERLTRQRCTLCHQATNYTNQRHTRIGWLLVVKRMVHLNEAPIPAPEQAAIIDFLAATYAAGREEQFIEHGVPVLTLGLLAGGLWGGRRLRRQRRRAAG